jgi:predicted nucleic acid-binding protein
VLLDTSGLLCFLHQDEAQHKTAVELQQFAIKPTTKIAI